MRLLEWLNPLLHNPTTGAIGGDELYYIANSQVDLVGEDGSLPLDKLANIVILKTRL